MRIFSVLSISILFFLTTLPAIGQEKPAPSPQILVGEWVGSLTGGEGSDSKPSLTIKKVRDDGSLEGLYWGRIVGFINLAPSSKAYMEDGKLKVTLPLPRIQTTLTYQEDGSLVGKLVAQIGSRTLTFDVIFIKQ